MKLQFRGKTYESSYTEWDVSEGEIGGIYRGKPWKVRHLKEKHRHNNQHTGMTYRGVRYTKD